MIINKLSSKAASAAGSFFYFFTRFAPKVRSEIRYAHHTPALFQDITVSHFTASGKGTDRRNKRSRVYKRSTVFCFSAALRP
jgi:hypothetical protein